MSRLKIIHLRSAEFFGGPERAIIGQSRSQADVNFVCASFVRGDGENTFLQRAQEAGLKTARIQDAFAGDFRVVGQIRRLVSEHRADILVCHDYKANFFGRLALKGTSVRQISHFRGKTDEDFKVRLYNFINSRLLRKVSTVLAVSEKSASFLRQLGVPASVIHVVPNAIEDAKLVAPDFRKKAQEDRPRRIIAAGRMSYEKGYDVLLDAVALVKEKAPPFIVQIYGFGPEQQNLQNQARRLGITDSIVFEGFADNMLPLFKESDFLVLPSRSEGMPNVILESWSQKLGVVSTTVGGVPEMIEHQVSGLLAAPEKPELLAEQVLYALTHPCDTIKYGEAGYELVRSKYCYAKQAELLGKIYRNAATD